MEEILSDFSGIACHVDDVLISGDQNLYPIIRRSNQVELLTREGNANFLIPEPFLGYVIDINGISLTPSKTVENEWLQN